MAQGAGGDAAMIDFRFDWLDGVGIKGPELAATFAALEIRVGADTITRCRDHQDGKLHDHIQVPLYPLAESLASNWWFLTGESLRSRVDTEDHDFRQRHSLVHGGDGYLFPNLIALPEGERVKMVWSRTPADDLSSLEFLDEGRADTGIPDFRQACASFIDKVLQRLDASDAKTTYLHDEWARISGADAEEVATCETAAGLGWDPYDLDDARWKALERLDRLGGILGEAVPAMDSGSPESVIESCNALTRAFEAARTGGGSFPDLESVRREIGTPVAPANRSAPWRDGYRLARRLRRILGLDGAPLPTEELARALEQPPGFLDLAPPADFSAAALFDGVVAQGTNGRASFALRQSRENSPGASSCVERWPKPSRFEPMPCSRERPHTGSSATGPSPPSSWPRRKRCGSASRIGSSTKTPSRNWRRPSAFLRWSSSVNWKTTGSPRSPDPHEVLESPD